MGKQARCRLIIHGGSHDNYMTDLKQYGLKAENLSRIIGGRFDNCNLMPLLMELESLSRSDEKDAVDNLTGEVVCEWFNAHIRRRRGQRAV
jgi:hypothetical protein